jgi:thiol peroxidase
MLSDHVDMAFSDVFGVHVSDMRICHPAAFVLDRDKVIRAAEYMPVIGSEGNFVAVLSKVQSLT